MVDDSPDVSSLPHRWYGTGLTRYWAPIHSIEAKTREEFEALCRYERNVSLQQGLAPIEDIDEIILQATNWAESIFQYYGLPKGNPYVLLSRDMLKFDILSKNEVIHIKKKMYESRDSDEHIRLRKLIVVIGQRCEFQSDLWYANEILRLHEIYERNRKELIHDPRGRGIPGSDPILHRQYTCRKLGASAYHIGYTFCEARWKFQYEGVALEGRRLQEGRKIGQVAACKTRRNIGKRRRNAVVSAARTLYEAERSLVRNDSATARRIEAKKLPALRQRNGTHLGDGRDSKAPPERQKRWIVIESPYDFPKFGISCLKFKI